MSFYKNYKNRKDWRKPHKRGKSVDPGCQNNHGCPWCEGNRLHNYKKRTEQANEQINDYLKGIQ